MKQLTVLFAIILVSASSAGSQLRNTIPFLSPNIAQAAEAWQNDFDDVCSRTEDAMTFSADELKNIITRSDAVKTQIEQTSDESRRRVMLKRLKMCRDLYAYVLSTLESK